jgi:hypothetical protein
MNGVACPATVSPSSFEVMSSLTASRHDLEWSGGSGYQTAAVRSQKLNHSLAG